MTLTEFLLARIAEDETGARAAMGAGAKWVTAADTAAGVAGADVGLFVLFHNPVRVLAECEAKRRIVETGQFDDSPESAVDFWLAEGVPGRTPPRPIGTLIAVFRALASVYADHPDYRDEWATRSDVSGNHAAGSYP